MSPVRSLTAATCLVLTSFAAHAEDEASLEASLPVSEHLIQPTQDDTTKAPEPSSMILTGIGGLALLFFALRRR